MSSTRAVRRCLLLGLLVLRSSSLLDTQVTSYFVAVTKGSIRKGRLWSDSHFAGTVHPRKEGVTSELRKIGHAVSTSGDSSPLFLFYSAWEPSPGDGTAHIEDWSLTLTQPLSVGKTVVCLPGHLDSAILTNLTATTSKHFSVLKLV